MYNELNTLGSVIILEGKTFVFRSTIMKNTVVHVTEIALMMIEELTDT